MEVHKYIPSRLYGFVKGEDGREVFFHLGVFKPGAFPTDPPHLLYWGNPYSLRWALKTHPTTGREKPPEHYRLYESKNLSSSLGSLRHSTHTEATVSLWVRMVFLTISTIARFSMVGPR